MFDIFINPLSANGQHHVTSRLERTITEMVSCLKFARPALQHKRARLIYDDTVEARSLTVGGVGFLAEINALSNRDTRVQWFLYTKNYALRASSELCLVVVSDYDGEPGDVEGFLRQELVVQDAKWLSFGGTVLSDQPRLNVTGRESGSRISLQNASTLLAFKNWWPRYEASPKHRKEGYWASGEWVSPMPLDNQIAQEVLLTSILSGNDRYALHAGEYYRFPLTHPGQQVYHGFSVDENEVPQDVLGGLRG